MSQLTRTLLLAFAALLLTACHHHKVPDHDRFKDNHGGNIRCTVGSHHGHLWTRHAHDHDRACRLALSACRAWETRNHHLPGYCHVQ